MINGINLKEETSPTYWFDISTKRINILAEIEAEIANKIINSAEEMVKKSANAIILNLFISIMAILLTIFISIILYKNITQQIQNFSQITIDESDLTRRVETTSNDEIGTLSIWFNKFISKIHEIIKDIKNYFEDLNKISIKLSEISQIFSS